MFNQDNFYSLNECGVCQSNSYALHLRDGDFEINRCEDCSTHWVTPRLKPEYLHEIYQTIYWKSDAPKDLGYKNYLGQRALYFKTFQRRYKSLMPFIESMNGTQNKRVLDIGCSNGVFLSLMASKSWTGVGVDLSNYIIEQAKKESNDASIAFYCGTLVDVISKNEKFDLITMWDVIEHVEKPLEILKEIHVRLHDDGILVLETQNARSLFAKVLGASWHHYKHFEHIYHFNPESLKYLLNKAGFEIQRISTANAGKYISFGFLLERSQRVLPKFIHRIVNKCFSFLSDKTFYANVHDEFIVVAKKII